MANLTFYWKKEDINQPKSDVTNSFFLFAIFSLFVCVSATLCVRLGPAEPKWIPCEPAVTACETASSRALHYGLKHI